MSGKVKRETPARTGFCGTLAAVLIAASAAEAQAQQLRPAPRLVVNITVDELRSDLLEYFAPLYGSDGFRRFAGEGRVYESAACTFSPVDRASATACIATGASPHYNNIIAQQWLQRDGLRTAYCVYDKRYAASPANMASSTIGDELKVSTDGRALVFGVAFDQDAAILSAGHAADGAFWMNGASSKWTTSAYYPAASQTWARAYNPQTPPADTETRNDAVARLALGCMTDHAMGRDEVTDYIAVTLSAGGDRGTGQRLEMESVYKSLDTTLGAIVNGARKLAGEGNVLFVLTGTGHTEEAETDYARYKIPTGTFYINRTSQLLNMYLSAVYGGGTWVEAYYKNQIYLNHKLIEDKKVAYSELIQRSKDFLRTVSGVSSVTETPYDTAITGDLWIEACPGWKIVNEDTNESYQSGKAYVPFPVVFLGPGVVAGRQSGPITTESIAPTIARAIRIRAPNACSATPLF